MAASDLGASDKKLEYIETLFGELYYGTKAELQSIGIAVGMAFPDEPEGPKRCLRVRDPRGFEAKVTRAYDERRYVASISLPGREGPSEQWREFAPGVKMCADNWWFDEYVGAAEALAAAGLLHLNQLPGQLGMRKVCVTILCDGTVHGLGMGHKRCREPGTKTIKRASKTAYRVRVVAPESEEEGRREAAERAAKEYEARMLALPRPASLIAFARALPEQTKAHLRLVWSASSASI